MIPSNTEHQECRLLRNALIRACISNGGHPCSITYELEIPDEFPHETLAFDWRMEFTLRQQPEKRIQLTGSFYMTEPAPPENPFYNRPDIPGY